MAKVSTPKFDFGPMLGEVTQMFQGVVQDVTDPKFQVEIQNLATDAATLAALKAGGASDELVQIGTDALKARGQAIVGIPGLIAAGREQQALAFVGRAANMLVGFGFNVVRAYAGLPPVPPQTEPTT